MKSGIVAILSAVFFFQGCAKEDPRETEKRIRETLAAVEIAQAESLKPEESPNAEAVRKLQVDSDGEVPYIIDQPANLPFQPHEENKGNSNISTTSADSSSVSSMERMLWVAFVIIAVLITIVTLQSKNSSK